MKMGATVCFFLFLALLVSVASARDAFMSFNADDAGRNALSMEEPMDLYEMAKIYEDEISSFPGSPTEFTEACLEISREVMAGIKDQGLVNEVNSLASALCHTLSSDLESGLKANGTCAVCRGILDTISSALGDTDKQLVIILFLIKACKIQSFTNECKRIVFTFGPAILTATKAIVSNDLCFNLKICSEARDSADNGTSSNHGGAAAFFGQQYNYVQTHELGNLDHQH